MEKQNEILQLISGREPLLIPAVDGQRFIQDANEIFEVSLKFINGGFVGNGIKTVEQEVEVFKLGKDATLMEMFACSSNTWNHKWLSQNQVIEFFEQLSSWLPEFKMAKTFFLCKKDEVSYINKSDLRENLVVVGICNLDNKLHVDSYQLNDAYIFFKRHGHQVVIPKFKY